MKHAVRKTAGAAKRGLSVLIAFMMILSVSAISGISLSAASDNTGNEVGASIGSDSVSANDGYDYVPADSSLENNSGLLKVNATYYDYWSDNERNQGKYLENEGDFENIPKWWYQFDGFNRYISSLRQSSWKYPMYFGNLFRYSNVNGSNSNTDYKYDHTGLLANKTVGWNGTVEKCINNGNPENYAGPYYNGNNGANKNLSNGISLSGLSHSNMFENDVTYAVNNSNGMSYAGGNFSQSLQGLVGKKLDSNGNILAPNGQLLPYFDGAKLKDATFDGQKVATVFKSVFPFRINTYSNGVTKYSYTSKNATDNIYFSWNDRTPATIKYGEGTGYGVHDKLSKFGGSSDGYGLFPFNNNSNHKNNRTGNDELDYGFGIRLDIDFRVPEKGLLPNGDHAKFNFTGDDDVWVYIGEDASGKDADLVLDLGGDHKEASGNIDFNTMKATADDVFADYSTSSPTVKKSAVSTYFNGSSSSSKNYLSPNKTYHMVVFYMERGESESNFSVDFTFVPMDNMLTTEKVVNTTNVNEGLKSTVESIDTFTVTNKDNGTSISNKAYTLTHKNGTTENKTLSNGSYTIKGGEKTTIKNPAKTGNTLQISESNPNTSSNKLTYTTKATVTDVENNKVVQTVDSSTTGANTSFKFANTKNTATEEYLTNYNVKFENTPDVGSLNVKKSAYLSDGTTPDADQKFAFKVELDVDKNGSYETYNLQYKTASGETKTASNGVFYLGHNEQAQFTGIPAGVKYKVTETENSLYTSSGVNNQNTISKNSTSNVTFTNTKKNTGSAVVQPQATKTMDMGNLDQTPESIFNFSITELKNSGTKLVPAQGGYTETVTNNGSDVVFTGIEYQYKESTDPTTPQPTTPQPTTAQPATQPTTQQVTTQPVTEPVANMMYFVPNSNWKKDNARFAMYLMSSSKSTTKWVSLTSADGTTYSAEIPSGDWKYVIFCRMNPSKTDNSWDNKWNQTDDLTISGNCCTLTNEEWNNPSASWSTKSSKSKMSSSVGAQLEPVEVSANTITTYYYSISENVLATAGSDYEFDDSVYYLVVNVNHSATPVTADAKYYSTEADAVSQKNPIDVTGVTFNNTHKATIQITKKNEMDNRLENAKFKLYKVDADGAPLKDANVVGEGTTNIDGFLSFDNLDVLDANNDFQWYAFAEINEPNGYVLDSTVRYFSFPVSREVEANSAAGADFTSNGKNYSYVLDDDDNYQFFYGFEVTNNLIVSPETSGTGTVIFMIIGIAVTGTAALVATGYAISRRRKRKLTRVRRY